MSVKSLIINPGSTSTKIGVFEDETLLFEETLRHSTEEISKYAAGTILLEMTIEHLTGKTVNEA